MNEDYAKVKAVMEFKPVNVWWDVPMYQCPILLSFMCIFSRDEKVDLSSETISVGQIYMRMIRCLYKKFTVRMGLEYDDKELVGILKSVGKLAYEMLLSGNWLLRRREVIREVGKLAFDIGLLIGHEDFRLIRDETADIFITFPHRSIQEFLGAFYFILKLNEEVDVGSSANIPKKIYKRVRDSNVGCAPAFSSILSEHNSFILENPLFF